MNQRRLGRILALAAALGAFVVYWLTLAHTITWQHNGADSGDLVTAAFVNGIPHPPGYPLYTLLAFFFARNPIFEPAHGVAIFSALMASASVFVLARAGYALLQTFEVSKTSKVLEDLRIGSKEVLDEFAWKKNLDH